MSYYDKISGPIGIKIYDQLVANGVRLNGVTADQIGQWYKDHVTSELLEPIDLEDVNPDFEEIFDKLQTEVSRFESWKDLSTASTGVMLLHMMAAIGTFNQMGIVRAAQETMPDTARLPNSIYAMTRLLGVRIIRKSPVSVLCTLNNSAITVAQIIPKFTQWSIGKYRFFNREQIVFNEGQTVLQGVKLYQGTVVVDEFTSNGQKNQRYEIGLEDFSVSDEDLECTVDGTVWKRVDDGLWRYPKQKIYTDKTTALGTAEIIFGDGNYGEIPPKDKIVSFTYARVLGLSAAFNETGLPVKCLTNSNVTGVSETGSQGGGDERDPEYYRQFAPTIYSNRKKFVTPKDYKANIIGYEDVIDCVVLGQRDIDPNDPKLFNLVYISVLTNTAWTEAQWSDFMKWVQENSLIGVKLLRKDPQAVILDIDATVYCSPDSNLDTIKNSLITHLRDSLKAQQGSLGKSIYKSDIFNLMQTEPSSRYNVTHIKLHSPMQDIQIDTSAYVRLRNINLTMAYGERGALT